MEEVSECVTTRGEGMLGSSGNIRNLIEQGKMEDELEKSLGKEVQGVTFI